MGGDGVNRNMMFESILIDSVIVIFAWYDWVKPKNIVSLLAGGLILSLLSINPLKMLLYSEQNAITVKRETRLLDQQFNAGVNILKNVRGPVVCEDLLMCFRAKHDSKFDPYFVMDQIKLGKMPEIEITDLVKDRTLSAVEIGATYSPARKKQIRFTSSFMKALTDHYYLAMRTPQFSIWKIRR